MQNEIAEMTNRELDAAIAIEVFGWKHVAGAWYSRDAFVIKGVSSYTTDPAEAFRIIELATAKGVQFTTSWDGKSYRATYVSRIIAENADFKRCVAEAALTVARQEATK